MTTVSAQEKSININGVRLHYLDWGTEGKMPLVCLHAHTMTAHLWDDFAASMSQHFHVFALDQRGHGDSEWSSVGYARDRFVEDLAAFVDELGLTWPASEPLIWLVHVISPSTYPEDRFNRLAEALAERNIGVICCPSAALSMRQLRPLATPTANSIARVLELLVAGVQVRLGSDNLCDVTSPAGTLDLIDELFVLSNAVRFYDIGILSKLAAGEPLDAADRATIRTHLDRDADEIALALGSR